MGENNKATIVGRFTKGFTYSYCTHGCNFYTAEIVTERLSGTYDYIPITISERLIDVRENYTGEIVELVGEFRSYNRKEEKSNPSDSYIDGAEDHILGCFKSVSRGQDIP